MSDLPKRMQPMTTQEVNELLGATLHGALPFETQMRVFATLAQNQFDIDTLSEHLRAIALYMGDPDCALAEVPALVRRHVSVLRERMLRGDSVDPRRDPRRIEMAGENLPYTRRAPEEPA